MADLDYRAQQQPEFQHNSYSENRNDAAQNLCNDAYKGFQGIDLGIVRLGTQNCSGVLDFNIGIARAGASIGQRTGAGAEIGVPGAKVGAEAGITADDRNGLRAGVNAGGELGPIAGTQIDLGAAIGPRTGVHANADTYVGPVDANGYGAAYIDRHGVHAHAGGGAEFAGVAGTQTHVRADVGVHRAGAEIKNHNQLGPLSSDLQGGAAVSHRAAVTYVQGDLKGLY